jgi:hypothetical protein
VLGERGKQKGKPQPDSSLRDTENVPLLEDIDAYFQREVLPHAPDAWIDRDKSKVGYEIPFNRHFYVFEPPRSLHEIDEELKGVTAGSWRCWRGWRNERRVGFRFPYPRGAGHAGCVCVLFHSTTPATPLYDAHQAGFSFTGSVMAFDKPPLSVDAQIDLLAARGMHIRIAPRPALPHPRQLLPAPSLLAALRVSPFGRRRTRLCAGDEL